MPLNDGTLEEIKSRVDIVDLISEFVSLKKSGQNWKGLCPFHTEKTASFTVSPSKQIYHCFGCGSGGDIFTFLVKYENLTFPEAMRTLAKRAGITLQLSRGSVEKPGEKETIFRLHKDALGFFRQCLDHNSGARRYLESRGIDGRAQNDFSLGYAPKSWNSLFSFLQKRGYHIEAIHKSGLITRGQKGFYDTFRGRVIFPIFDLRGDVVAFGGRSLDGSEPKYLNSPETAIFNKRKVLYGLNRARDFIRKKGCALLMEGYTDVITASSHGFLNAVAPLGTAFTEEHGKLIKRFTEDVILVFDSDVAGMEASKNAAAILLESGLNVKVISFPDKDDPDGFLRRKDGERKFGRLLENALSIVDFLMIKGGDKRLLSREALEIISKIPDRVLQGEYVKALSEKLGINERYVREEFLRVRRLPAGRHGKSSPAPSREPDITPLDEAYMIKLLLQMPDKVQDVAASVPAECFRNPVTRDVFLKIISGCATLDELLKECDAREQDFLTGISMYEDFEDPDKALGDCIEKLLAKKRTLILRDLQGRIKEAEQNKDMDLLRSLQVEQCAILKSRRD
jgi:DNA primase